MNLHNQSLRTWIPLIDKNIYRVIIVDGNLNLNTSSQMIHNELYSHLTLKVDDDYYSLTKKMKMLFKYLIQKLNCPYYWIFDNDSYIDAKLLNKFFDYSADWYGQGWWFNGEVKFIIGCGHYMSNKFITKASIEMDERWQHFYDTALGEVFQNNNFTVKFTDLIHHDFNIVNDKIENKMIIHKLSNIEQYHKKYK